MKSKVIKNVFWNFSGGIISGLALVFATPLYIKLIGLEAYGILSIWLVLQVLMGFLDFGIGPTIVKELARINNRSQGTAVNLIRTAEVFIGGISLIFLLFFWLSSTWIGVNWFKTTTIDKNYLSIVVKYMSLALALQFPVNIYMNVLTGLQEHQRMNIVLMLSNILKYVIGLTMLYLYSDLRTFFIAQAILAGLITLISRQVAMKGLRKQIDIKASVDFKIFIPIWKFSLGMACTSFAAVLLSNVDRLVLSNLVSTEALGKYAVAFTATGILQLAIQPFYKAYFPRYAELVKLGNEADIEREYFQSSRIMSAIIISMSTVGFVFAPQLFTIWIGKADFQIIQVFRILIVSITCSGLMWLPSALQQAYSWTSLHLMMIMIALIIGIPFLIYGTKQYGILGGTIVWVIHGISEITLGLWLMHRKLIIGKFVNWYMEVLFPPTLIALPLTLLSFFLIPNSENNFLTLAKISITGIIILLTILLYTLKRNKVILNKDLLKTNIL